MRNNRILPLAISFILLVCIDLVAQNSNSIYYDNTSSSRYDNVDGSPYLYKDWLSAEIIASSGEVYTEEKVNFNGHSQNIEYYEENKIKEMMSGTYLKVSFITEDGRQTFMRGLHPDFGMDLVCVLYDGESVDFVKRLFVKIQEYNTPNATISKFVPRTEYYMIVNDRMTITPLKKKKILAVLKGSSSDLESYIDENDLSLKSETEVIQLLNFNESGKN